MAEAQDFESSSCSICLDSNQFRVLNCGHAFCLNCLQSMHSIYGGKIPCPLDRIEDAREPRTLPTPNQFKGKLFPVFEVDERYTSIDQLLHAQLRCREKTVEIVRGIAGDLNSDELKCAIAKITGGVFGVRFFLFLFEIYSCWHQHQILSSPERRPPPTIYFLKKCIPVHSYFTIPPPPPPPLITFLSQEDLVSTVKLLRSYRNCRNKFNFLPVVMVASR